MTPGDRMADASPFRSIRDRTYDAETEIRPRPDEVAETEDVSDDRDDRRPDAEPETLDRVVIRFAGDSGDGMQLAGDRFTDVSAAFGNDLATLPELPGRDPGARRAPSPACRRSRSTSPTTTSSRPGTSPNVLVAMNPAALKANIERACRRARRCSSTRTRSSSGNLDKAGYPANPLEDGSLRRTGSSRCR